MSWEYLPKKGFDKFDGLYIICGFLGIFGVYGLFGFYGLLRFYGFYI